MTSQPSTLEQRLVELGKARREGAFSADAARYPWRTAAPEVIRLPLRRFAWARWSASLAAAAAIAIFVGPSLFDSSKPVDVAFNPAVDSDRLTTEDRQPSVETVAAADRDDCDFNKDGVTNGLDIQQAVVLLSRVEDEAERIERQAQFQRCLLRI